MTAIETDSGPETDENVPPAGAEPGAPAPRPESPDEPLQRLADADASDGEGEAEQKNAAEICFRVGEPVDVLDEVELWSEAEIVLVEDARVFVHHIYWGARYDEWVPRDSARLQPYGTHAFVDHGTLRAGQRVDCLAVDETPHKWREARIMEEREADVLVHFKGFSHERFDEWIPRASKRLLPFGRQTRKHYHKGRLVRQVGDPVAKPKQHTRIVVATSDRFSQYREGLARAGLCLRSVAGDGNCLFRSVAHQVYGDDSLHALVRERCMDYMEVEAEYFSPYVLGTMEDFYRYIAHKRRNAVWGDDPEMQAMCELYDRPAEVWAWCPRGGAQRLRTFHESHNRHRPPMRLSYYGGGHYDSIVPLDGDGGGEYPEAPEPMPPGVLEDAALERARARRAGVLPARASADPGPGAKYCEDEADAAVSAALEASRSEFDGQWDNLETALEESLKGVDAQEDSALRAAASDSEMLAVQQQMLEQAQKQSEDEQLQAALAASSSAAALTPEEEEAQLRAAMEASTTISSAAEDEEAQLRAAMEASVASSGADVLVDEDAQLRAALAASSEDVRAQQEAALRAAEEAELQRALEASMRGT